MPTSKIEIKHARNEKIITGVQHANQQLFRFIKIGANNYMDKNSIDALLFISAFTKAELHLLQVANSNVTKTNRLIIRKSAYPLNEQRQLTFAVKCWLKKGLIKREKREHYIINPYFFVPDLDNQRAIKDTWNTL